MAYADRNEGGTRIVAAVIVAFIMAALGYAFVTGLAYQYVKKAAEKLNTFDVAPPPPPPPDEPPPPPPPDQPLTPPPVVSPPPIVQTPIQTPPQITTVAEPPKVFNPTPVVAPPAPPAPAAPPAPPKPSLGASAKLRSNLGDIFTGDQYPASARREGIQGRVGITLVVGTNGRITSCTVSGSSGNSELDNTTCRLAQRSVRYDPAKDTNGNPIEQTVRLGVKWQLEDE